MQKLTEDPDLVEEKAPVEREKKKISFADEVGGRLCDIKVYELDQTSLELKQNPESLERYRILLLDVVETECLFTC